MKPFSVVCALLIVLSASSMGQESTSLKHRMDSTAVKKPAMHRQQKNATNVVRYTCTMHPEIISDKPGKCPKCKMQLVKVDVKKTKGAVTKHNEIKAVVFTCPMHPDVKSDKPGKCPKCKMNLVKEQESK